VDIALHCFETGQGEVMLLLHGNGEDHGYFKRQYPYFESKYRLIAVDTRGHGASPRGEKPFTISQFAEDLKDFMDEKGIESAHILGFSDGGNIALYFALRYPERIKKLIVNGANLNPWGMRWDLLIPMYFRYFLWSLQFRKKPELQKQMDLYRLMLAEPQIKPASLSALKIPTLVIAGTRDMIRKGHTETIAKSIPGARLIFLEGDHFIARRKHEAFNKAVEDFLKA